MEKKKVFSQNQPQCCVALLGYQTIIRTYLDDSFKAFVMGRELELEDINYQAQGPAEKPRVFNKERFLYQKLYEEVHWLFDNIREAQVYGIPLKLKNKKKTG